MRTVWGLLVGLLMVPSATFAIPLFQADDVVVEGGTLTYDGAGGPLVGLGILFDEFRSNADTPLNPLTPLACVGCAAAFTTGANTAEGVANGAPWVFGSNPAPDAFELIGSVPALGLPAGTVLAIATITNAAVGVIDTANIDFFASLSLGISDVHPTLAGFYGLPEILVLALTNAGQTLSVGADASLNLVSANNDAVFSDVTQVVSNPMALLLLGLGLVGVTFVRRV